MTTLSGRLLIASPGLEDPNFGGAVVYVIDHDDNGAVGVVINQPTETPIALHFEELARRVTPPDVFFVGGPVAPDTVLGVGRTGDRLTIVDLDAVTSGDLVVDGLRLFAGYSGWGSRQLDTELLRDDWIVVEGFDGDVFAPRPEDLWREILRRQGGAVARLSLYPDSPMVN